MELRSIRKSKNLYRPRSIFYYLARKYTPSSWSRIGQIISKDHTSVMWGARQLKVLCLTDPALDAKIKTYEQLLGGVDSGGSGSRTCPCINCPLRKESPALAEV